MRDEFAGTASDGAVFDRSLQKLKSFPLQSAQRILDRCNERGYSVLSIEDQDYPRQLLSLCDPPLVLYVQGDTRLLGMMETLPVLAVVGTRNPSDYGVRAAKDLSRKLAQMGLVIVSGLAMGIDACAHQSTLSVHGKTVAVLGCGLDYTYPAQTAGLREQILRQGGTVLSELAPAVSVNGNISGSQSTHRGIVSGSFGGGSTSKKRCTHYSFLRSRTGQGCVCSAVWNL